MGMAEVAGVRPRTNADGMQHPKTLIRRAQLDDVGALAAMNKAAYPDLVAEGVVWSAAQLAAHQTVFPAGQIVASRDHRIVGAISTLIVPSADALRQHTWMGITGAGLFTTHDPSGDTLYLADVYVDPEHWGRGVGSALYASLRALCTSLGRARVVAGGRLWGYFEYEGSLTPMEYVRKVEQGELRDRVLNSQLRAGFEVRGILDEYLDDPRSGSYATLLEWTPTRG